MMYIELNRNKIHTFCIHLNAYLNALDRAKIDKRGITDAEIQTSLLRVQSLAVGM